MNPIGIVLRRIIYAIPLKLLLILLAVFGVFYACFSSADEIQSIILQPGATWTKSLVSQESYNSANSRGNILCIQTRSDEAGASSCTSVKITFQDGSTISGNPYMGTDSTNQKMFCTIGGVGTFSVRNTSSATCNYHIIRFDRTQLIDTLTCQTEYNLIPIESVDQNYCTSNNLCPTYDCPTNPIGSGTLSNLYINNILHIGAPNIIMNIPEEIDWDYAYTQGGTTMNIDVVGYNQDQEMIQGWIDTNNYKPTSDDFTNIFKNFSNFGGLLIGALFVILVFYFVKKMFK